ncbi:EutN/CcmL family microcompartment protein [Extibacter muris]|uniref:EutN/CcmL family microcompartment protein n=1 Tax=Extibacter muris TaxID=1796622 RepID=UPI001D07D50C|nr:EutN/CcmL family microcompartment protein [Extibacter muris]MCB6201575.1 EutN/CcmL family microcompartment protein [Extibacter muris]MCQ4662901.1 EutN/CcmL family microcompartment protein [Extibacter muris]MCQ4694199.1 EutN/CcmL family microcompartment protein [Extibacter muris]
MMIARVVGNIVSTQKHGDYKGQKLLIVRAANLTGELYGPEMVAVDGADTDSGIGDLVLVIQEGGSARQAARCGHNGPIDASVIAVADSIETKHGNLYE